MPVTLRFVRDSAIYDPLIAYFGHGWPTHVDVVIPAGTVAWAPYGGLYGARFDGVKLRPFNYADRFCKQAADVTLSPRDSSAYGAGLTETSKAAIEGRFYAFLKEQEGKPYDFLNVFGFVDMIKRDRHDGHWFCSALVAGALDAMPFFPYPLARQSYEISPPELLLVVSAFAPVNWIAAK